MQRLTFTGLGFVFTGLIFGFIYFSESKILLTLIAVFFGVTLYRRLEYSFYVIAFLTPLLVRAPELLGTSNFSIAELIVLVVLAAWMFKKGLTGDVSWKHTPLDLPLLVFFSFTLLSAIAPISRFMFPVYYFESFSQLYPAKVLINTFEAMMLYFFVANNFDKKYLKGVVTALVAGLVAASIVGLIQYTYFISGFPMDRWFKEYDPVTVTSTLNNKNFFGMYLILLIPLTYYLTSYYKGSAKTLPAIAATLATLALIVSHSRGALIGLISTMVLVSAVKKKRFFLYGVLALIIIGSTILGTPQFRETSFAGRFIDMGKDVDGRIDCFNRSFATALQNPLGIGAGTFREKRICSYGDKWWSFTFHHAHNLYLQILVERGWLALGAFLYLLLAYFWKVMATKYADAYTRKVVWGLSIGILAVLIHGLVDYPFYSQRIALLFFFVMGVVAALLGDR
ncbi:MAG: O-antigen ligase family protein [Candidatus Altiarchaeota archaeon]